MPDPLPKSGSPPLILPPPTGRFARFRVQISIVLDHSATQRYFSALAPAAALILALFCSGCGSGFAFDGGHIPPGGGLAATNVGGIAFDAESISTPVAGATVVVTNLTDLSPRHTQTTITASDGSFLVSAIPDVQAANQYLVTVTPPPTSNRVAQQYSLVVNGGQAVSIMAAMPATSFDESQVASVEMLQQGYTLHTGDTVDFAAELLNSSGTVLPDVPSLVFIGSFGTLQPSGLFTSTAAGTGSVSAYWYNGTQTLQSTNVTVMASASIAHVPPPPP